MKGRCDLEIRPPVRDRIVRIFGHIRIRFCPSRCLCGTVYAAVVTAVLGKCFEQAESVIVSALRALVLPACFKELCYLVSLLYSSSNYIERVISVLETLTFG